MKLTGSIEPSHVRHLGILERKNCVLFSKYPMKLWIKTCTFEFGLGKALESVCAGLHEWEAM